MPFSPWSLKKIFSLIIPEIVLKFVYFAPICSPATEALGAGWYYVTKRCGLSDYIGFSFSSIWNVQRIWKQSHSVTLKPVTFLLQNHPQPCSTHSGIGVTHWCLFLKLTYFRRLKWKKKLSGAACLCSVGEKGHGADYVGAQKCRALMAAAFRALWRYKGTSQPMGTMKHD